MKNLESLGRIGFVYKFQCLGADGQIKWEQEAHNLIPDQGRDYLLSAALLAGSQFSNWYIGLFEGAYLPVTGDTMATFPGAGAANEITTYTDANRLQLVPDALSAGTFVNGAAPAVFTFSADKTVRGGFISSNAVKGGTTGILLSAVLSPSPKDVVTGDQLRVTAGLSLLTV